MALVVDRTRGPVPLRAAGDPFSFMGGQSAAGGMFSLSNVDQDILRSALARWTDQGYGITLGQTSDGGAFGVHLLIHGQKRSRYFSDVAALEDFLQTVPGPPVR